MWSAIIIGDDISKKRIKTRLTNNPVENWFGQLKNNIAQNKKLYTSELTSTLYEKLDAKYIQFYNKVALDKSSSISLKDKDYIEVWKKGNPKSKKKKGYFFDNHDIMAYGNYYNYQLSNIENDSFSEIFDKYSFNAHCDRPENIQIAEETGNKCDNHKLEEELVGHTKRIRMDTNNSSASSIEENIQMDIENDFDSFLVFYSLKFENCFNGCYCNSIFQAILGLGKNFFLKVLIINFTILLKTQLNHFILFL